MVGLLVNLAQKERKHVCSAFSQLCCLDFSGKCGSFKVKQQQQHRSPYFLCKV